MDLRLLSWNGNSINNGTPFFAWFPRGSKVNYSGNVVTVPRAGNYPTINGIVPNSPVLQIGVRIAEGQNINTNREVFKQYFNFEDGQRHNLIAEDGSGGTQWYLTGIVRQVNNEGNNENSFLVLIQTEYPYWRLVTATDTTWSVTGTAQTQAITNAGNIAAKPKLTLTPTVTKSGGLSYRRHVAIYNNLDVSYIAPLDITAGGLNTSALVADTSVSNQINVGGGITNSATSWAIDTAVGGGLATTGGAFYMGTEQCTYTSIAAGTISGVTRGVNGTTAATHGDNTVMTRSKVEADGEDFRVWKNNTEIDCWLYNMNASATKCWVNESLSPRQLATLSGSLANNSSDATVSFKQTRANLAVLQFLKSATENYFMIGTEIFRYTPANINLVTYSITTVKRAQKGSSAAGHSDGDTIRYITLLQILYGDSSLGAPDVDDGNKPMISLSSTNGAWSWSNFYDEDERGRTAGWRGEVLASRTGLSYVYTASENTFATPSETLGLALIGSMDFQVQNETGTLDWIFSHPAGITDITNSGKKYNTASWPAVIGLQYLQPNAVWFTAYNHDAPALSYFWEAFGPVTTTFTAPYPNTLRFVIDGLLSSALGEAAAIQNDTITATFASANLPTISVSAEETVNFFDVKITNNTSGEYLTVKVPCAVNDTLTIDCENKAAYLGDGSPVAVTLSTDRAEWLDLSPGSNTLRYDDVGTQAVTMHVIHRDRTL
jgi:phage-related protein